MESPKGMIDPNEAASNLRQVLSYMCSMHYSSNVLALLYYFSKAVVAGQSPPSLLLDLETWYMVAQINPDQS